MRETFQTDMGSQFEGTLSGQIWDYLCTKVVKYHNQL